MNRLFSTRLIPAGLLLALSVASPARADDGPLRVLLGEHGAHSRLVVVLPKGGRAVLEPQSCGGRVVLGRASRWPLVELNRTWVKRLSDFQTADKGRALEFAWPCGAEARAWRERNAFIVDVADPVQDKPSQASTAERSEPLAEAAAPARSPAAAEPPPVPVAAASDPVPPPGPSQPASPAGAAGPASVAASGAPQPLIPPEGRMPSRRTASPTPEHAVANADAPLPAAIPVAAPAGPASAPPAPRGSRQARDASAPGVRPSVDPGLADAVRRAVDQLGTADAPAPRTARPGQREGEAAPSLAIGPFDPAGWAGPDHSRRNAELRGALDAAAPAQRAEAALALARFYLGWAMPEEGRAALQELGPQATQPQRNTAKVLEEAFRVTSGLPGPEKGLLVTTRPVTTDDHVAWRAVAQAHPIAGPDAWREARRDLPAALRRLAVYPPMLRLRLLGFLADGASAAGDADALDRVVAQLGAPDLAALAPPTELYRGRASELRGQLDTALAQYERAGAGAGRAASRARLAALELRRTAGRIDDATLIDALESLRRDWRGDDVEPEALRALGEAQMRAGRIGGALDALDLLVRRFTGAPQGGDSARAARGLVDALMDRGQGLDPLALHLRYVDLIAAVDPDGALRRRLAAKLAGSGFGVEAERLLSRAAESLEGEPAAGAALDLAALLIADDRPVEALDTLRHVSERALPTATADRLRLLRAEALLRGQRPLEALEAVRTLEGAEAARLRAAVFSEAGEWRAAKTAYAGILEAAPATPRNPDDVARYGIAAFRSGDEVALREANARYRAELRNTRWEGLLEVLAGAPAPTQQAPVSRDEVTRELEAAANLIGVAARWSAPAAPR
ncbi:hypothetical protein [Arenibaculum pallidiluteum]|uniref:hypothetical protein n=1 Tax=Arenibaculum pallidiluteum TaxID=2812559 RepID=UPI001A9594FF|nr:hypothetical protein [Arenibaculum pallidiluteum]